MVHGIALIITCLQRGISEYTTWCQQAGYLPRRERPQSEDAWIVEFVADHETGRSARDPGDDDWEPAGRLPRSYAAGLELSTLVMMANVYGR